MRKPACVKRKISEPWQGDRVEPVQRAPATSRIALWASGDRGRHSDRQHPLKRERPTRMEPNTAALESLFKEVQSPTERIQPYDHEIEKITKQHYPEVARLQQVNGVGTLIVRCDVAPDSETQDH